MFTIRVCKSDTMTDKCRYPRDPNTQPEACVFLITPGIKRWTGNRRVEGEFLICGVPLPKSPQYSGHHSTFVQRLP